MTEAHPSSDQIKPGSSSVEDNGPFPLWLEMETISALALLYKVMKLVGMMSEQKTASFDS
jgi:hypothetical protein